MMKSMKFQLWNNITGWLTFLFAFTVYALTAEPTVSFWDCGEFISAADKLQVVHPPGSPVFILIGRMFTMFADPTSKAFAINILSALSSALTILFITWVVTSLAQKLFSKSEDEYTQAETLAILGSGLVFGLTATFIDSFWFSAVEGEVYALSSFFTAIIVWAIFKWEKVADTTYSNRWLIFIGLMIGLGAGVHLLHLLAIPAIVIVFYFKRFKYSLRSFILALLIGVGIVAFVLYGVLDVFVRIAANLDLFFVNSLGLPFNSGSIFFILLLVAGSVFGIYYSRKQSWVTMRAFLLSFIMMLLGISTNVVSMIRANANTPINMNDPSDMYTLFSYLKREQYGSRPLLYGPMYTAKIIDAKETGTRYRRGKEEYIPVDKRTEYLYDVEPLKNKINPAQYMQLKRSNKMIPFPRMGSIQNPTHERQYKTWLFGDPRTNEMPTFGDNLRFFFKYQLGYMYMRYFFWNFSGRQDDIQGHIDDGLRSGNWITGFEAIDNGRLGGKLDRFESRVNDARNSYFFIPVLIGLLGAILHFRMNPKGASVVLLFFLFTGIVNIINMNEPPSEPRERDYATAISYYAFAMWIGLAVVTIFKFLTTALNDKLSSKGSQLGLVSAVLAICFVPAVLMGTQGWDDHDRSNKYLARDQAIAYLESCDKNAVLFTQGDNDTYPLWYAQEVEGIRTDVRVINLSLLAVDWYIAQLNQAKNEAPPIKIRFEESDYIGSKRMQLPIKSNPGFVERYGNDWNTVLDFVKNDNASTKVSNQGGVLTDYIPTKTLKLPVNKENVIANNIVDPKYRDRIADTIVVNISPNDNSIIRDELMILDIIASANWERPIYFALTVSSDKKLSLGKYLQREGLAYKLSPVEGMTREWTHIEKMYKNVTEKWSYGNLKDNSVHLDETNMRTAMLLRSSNLLYLIQEFDRVNDTAKVNTLIDLIHTNFNIETVPYTQSNEIIAFTNLLVKYNRTEIVEQYYPYYIDALTSEPKYFANEVLEGMVNDAIFEDPNMIQNNQAVRQLATNLNGLKQFISILENSNNADLASKAEAAYNALLNEIGLTKDPLG